MLIIVHSGGTASVWHKSSGAELTRGTDLVLDQIQWPLCPLLGLLFVRLCGRHWFRIIQQSLLSLSLLYQLHATVSHKQHRESGQGEAWGNHKSAIILCVHAVFTPFLWSFCADTTTCFNIFVCLMYIYIIYERFTHVRKNTYVRNTFCTRF